MKAAVFVGKEDIQVKDVPKPEISSGEILVRVQCAGICGGDMSIYAGKHPRAKAPLVPGHEVLGRIEEIGSAVSGNWAKGMRVVIYPVIACGRCRPCLEGRGYVCETLRVVGIDRDGGFAEFVKVEPNKLIPVPDDIADEQAVVIEPLAVCVHAVENSMFRTGDSALVVGGGPIGNLCAQVLRASGARDVVISETKPYRRELAARLGFKVIDPAAEDVNQGLQRLLGERFVDSVFEATGFAGAYKDALAACKVRGQVNFVGIPKSPPEIDVLTIVFKELFTSSARMYRVQDYMGAIALLSRGAIEVLPLIERLALNDAPEGFHKMKAADTSLKVLLVP
jgi:2-desacetyl-2-hydroxyethyl bacteriochlorophyllide A dehydrogenase